MQRALIFKLAHQALEFWLAGVVPRHAPAAFRLGLNVADDRSHRVANFLLVRQVWRYSLKNLEA